MPIEPLLVLLAHAIGWLGWWLICRWYLRCTRELHAEVKRQVQIACDASAEALVAAAEIREGR